MSSDFGFSGAFEAFSSGLDVFDVDDMAECVRQCPVRWVRAYRANILPSLAIWDSIPSRELELLSIVQSILSTSRTINHLQINRIRITHASLGATVSSSHW